MGKWGPAAARHAAHHFERPHRRHPAPQKLTGSSWPWKRHCHIWSRLVPSTHVRPPPIRSPARAHPHAESHTGFRSPCSNPKNRTITSAPSSRCRCKEATSPHQVPPSSPPIKPSVHNTKTPIHTSLANKPSPSPKIPHPSPTRQGTNSQQPTARPYEKPTRTHPPRHPSSPAPTRKTTSCRPRFLPVLPPPFPLSLLPCSPPVPWPPDSAALADLPPRPPSGPPGLPLLPALPEGVHISLTHRYHSPPHAAAGPKEGGIGYTR